MRDRQPSPRTRRPGGPHAPRARRSATLDSADDQARLLTQIIRQKRSNTPKGNEGGGADTRESVRRAATFTQGHVPVPGGAWPRQKKTLDRVMSANRPAELREAGSFFKVGRFDFVTSVGFLPGTSPARTYAYAGRRGGQISGGGEAAHSSKARQDHFVQGGRELLSRSHPGVRFVRAKGDRGFVSRYHQLSHRIGAHPLELNWKSGESPSTGPGTGFFAGSSRRSRLRGPGPGSGHIISKVAPEREDFALRSEREVELRSGSRSGSLIGGFGLFIRGHFGASLAAHRVAILQGRGVASGFGFRSGGNGGAAR